MSDLTIRGTDLSDARNFLLQYLRDAGYEGSLEDGTALNDLLIRAISVLYTMFQTDVDRAQAYQSLERAESLKGVLGEEYDDVVDSILSNWFVTRKSGTPSRGYLRLTFARPLDFLEFKGGQVLALINGVQFAVAEATTYTASDYIFVANAAQSSQEFYIDVPVTSVGGSEVLIQVGARPVVYLNNIYLLRGSVAQDFIQGTDQESSSDFINRTSEAITTRELISYRALYTVLMNEFSELRDLYVAGFGDQEQLRDLTEFQDVIVHVGNKADIYLDSPLFETSTTYEVDLGGGADMLVAPVDIVSVQARTSEEAEWEEAEYIVSGDTALWASTRSRPRVDLSSPDGYTQMRVNYLSTEMLEKVREFIYSYDQRVACYDPLVKSKLPILLAIGINCQFKEGQDTTAGVQAVKDEALRFVRDTQAGGKLIVSELVSRLHYNVEGLERITLPLVITYKLRDPATKEYTSGVVDDVFYLPEGMSEQVSWKTTQFYCSQDLIDVELQG